MASIPKLFPTILQPEKGWHEINKFLLLQQPTQTMKSRPLLSCLTPVKIRHRYWQLHIQKWLAHQAISGAAAINLSENTLVTNI